MYFYNDTQNTNEEIEKNISEENVANSILASSGVNSDDVPIDIEEVMRSYDFAICVATSFVNEKIGAGIAYSDKKLKKIDTGRYFVFKKDIPNRDRRYFMSLAISYFVMESGGILSEDTV